MPTPNAGIPWVPEGTLDPAAALNESLRVIDALIQPLVVGMNVDDPPGSPADGDRYIVGIGTGDWTGQDDNLAQWVEEGAFWQFYEAGSQVVVVVYADAVFTYSGSGGWVAGNGIPDAPSDGQTYGRQDGAWVVLTGGSDTIDLVTEASPFTADPAIHAGVHRIVSAGGNVTFNTSEGYSAGEAYNVRAIGTLSLVGTGVTLTPPADGTLDLTAGMTVTVVMTSGTAGFVIGQTVAA